MDAQKSGSKGTLLISKMWDYYRPALEGLGWVQEMESQDLRVTKYYWEVVSLGHSESWLFSKAHCPVAMRVGVQNLLIQAMVLQDLSILYTVLSPASSQVLPSRPFDCLCISVICKIMSLMSVSFNDQLALFHCILFQLTIRLLKISHSICIKSPPNLSIAYQWLELK